VPLSTRRSAVNQHAANENINVGHLWQAGDIFAALNTSTASRIVRTDTMDDAAATRACLTGNVEAFRHFVERYQSRALAHARLLTRHEADAADATQDAFVDAFRNLRRFDPVRQFYAWFYVLLRNRCFKQRTRRGTRAESGIIPARAVEPGVSEEHLDLWRAIDRLSPDDAELVVLKHIEGWTYEELSNALEIPRGTVMSRLYVARQRLVTLLSGETP
jgi:RNA polymerase sigma-70 factor (ECF subfamily)